MIGALGIVCCLLYPTHDGYILTMSRDQVAASSPFFVHTQAVRGPRHIIWVLLSNAFDADWCSTSSVRVCVPDYNSVHLHRFQFH